jgi:glycosyltransferase involved in cell wall biosynthesis
VIDQATGLVTNPTPEGLAAAMDHLWENRALAKQLGAAGRDRYFSMDISWSNVVDKLLA